MLGKQSAPAQDSEFLMVKRMSAQLVDYAEKSMWHYLSIAEHELMVILNVLRCFVGLGMVAHTFSPSTQHRQVDFHEFEVSLFYLVNSRPARAA